MQRRNRLYSIHPDWPGAGNTVQLLVSCLLELCYYERKGIAIDSNQLTNNSSTGYSLTQVNDFMTGHFHLLQSVNCIFN